MKVPHWPTAPVTVLYPAIDQCEAKQGKGTVTGADSHDLNPHASLTPFHTFSLCQLVFIPGHPTGL